MFTIKYSALCVPLIEQVTITCVYFSTSCIQALMLDSEFSINTKAQQLKFLKQLLILNILVQYRFRFEMNVYHLPDIINEILNELWTKSCLCWTVILELE